MILTVNSFEEAKNYPVMFNSSELLMDNTQDVFYVKSVDNIGKITIESYKFERIENQLPLCAENFVTKQQFEQLTTKIDSIIDKLGGANNEQHIQEPTPSTPTPTSNKFTTTPAVRPNI